MSQTTRPSRAPARLSAGPLGPARPYLAIMAAALAAAACANLFRDAPLAWDWRPGQASAAIPAAGPIAVLDDPAELERLMARPGVVLADARDPRLFFFERLPGAVSWPASEADGKAGEWLAAVPPGEPVVAYCQESLCPLAERLALALTERGAEKVLIFRPGVEGWRDSGRPVAGPGADAKPAAGPDPKTPPGPEAGP